MNKLFKNILIPTIVGSTILPIVSCSNKQTIGSDTIVIISQLDDITIVQNEDYLSQPIEAKCFGPDKQEKYLDISFELKAKGFDALPSWITLTSQNQIKITSAQDVGDYEFSLIAYNAQEKLYSQSKIFNIKVISERHIEPDSISLEIERTRYCMYGEKSTIPMKIVPFKEGVEEKYLLNETKFYIEVIQGTRLDKNNNDLFYIEGSNLMVSSATDIKYVGLHRLKITAVLVSNPTIYDQKYIDIVIDNIYQQYNSKCKCTFTRSSVDDTWALSSIDKDTHILYNLPTVIQDKPITKIAENVCFKSQITDLVEIILPPTIVSIGANAFNNQTALSCIEMPGVKYVGKSAFENCSLLEFRVSSKKPKFYYVGSNAFYNCKLIDFDDQNEIMWIGGYAFKNAGLRQFSIGEYCYYIGTESFAQNNNISEFKILTPEPPEIGGAIFNKTDNFSDIKVPVEYVDKYIANPYWSRLGKNIKGI